MIQFHKRGLAQLNALRRQIESRLLGNHDYLALLALDRAVSEFRSKSLAETQAVFKRWGAAQRHGPRPDGADSFPLPDPDGKGD